MRQIKRLIELLRIDMPQIKGKDLPEMLDILRKNGVAYRDGKIAVQKLKPTQTDAIPSKLDAIASGMRPGESPSRIVVSRDGSIIDGHHRWLAARQVNGKDFKMDVVMIMLPKEACLKMFQEDINLPVNKGDTILTGKFKNHPTVVKKIGKGDDGMPTINDRPAVKFRIPKKVKKESFITEMPHISDTRADYDLHIERYPMTPQQKKQIMLQYTSDEGITGMATSHKYMLRFKRAGVTVEKDPNARPSRIQLPHYWEKYVKKV